jgi:molybdopterin synthase sulfur carrier subunit
MSTKILIPTPLRGFTEQKDHVQLDAATVGEALSNLSTQYPTIKRHLYTDEGSLRSYVNIYVNDDDIRVLNKEHTPVAEGDVILIIPAIAGGCIAIMNYEV